MSARAVHSAGETASRRAPRALAEIVAVIAIMAGCLTVQALKELTSHSAATASMITRASHSRLNSFDARASRIAYVHGAA